MQQYNPTTSSGLQTTGRTVFGPTEINGLVTRSGTVLLPFPTNASKKRKLDNGDHVVKKLCFTCFDEFIESKTVFSPAEANGLVTRSGAVLLPLPSITSHQRKLGSIVKKLCFMEVLQQYQAARRSSITNKQTFVGLHTRSGRTVVYGPDEVDGIHTRSGAVVKSPTFKSSKVTI